MALFTKEALKIIEEMVKALSNGAMEENIMDYGKLVNIMEKVSIQTKKELQKLEYGIMVSI